MIAPLAGLPLPPTKAAPLQNAPTPSVGFEAHLTQQTAPLIPVPAPPPLTKGIEEVDAANALMEPETTDLEVDLEPEALALPILPSVLPTPPAEPKGMTGLITESTVSERDTAVLTMPETPTGGILAPVAEAEAGPYPPATEETAPPAPRSAELPQLPTAPVAQQVAQPDHLADALPEVLDVQPEAPAPEARPTTTAAPAAPAIPSKITPEAPVLEPTLSQTPQNPAETPLTPEVEKPEPTTAPAAAPATRATPPLLRNVLDRLSEIELVEGKTRLLLRPKGLGVLEIDISRHLNGGLQIAIRAENPLLLDALRQESGAMSAFLGERGFNLAGGEPDLGRYAPPPPEGEAGAGADAAAETSGGAADDDSAALAAHRSLLTGGRIDLMT